MTDIFVSYASEDLERVRPLVTALENQGWSVWWDRALVAGPSFAEKIEEALNDASCVVVVWSTNSIKSRWVKAEATEGLENECLVPLLIDDVRPPLIFRSSQTAKLFEWPEQTSQFHTLTAGIASILGTPVPTTPAPEAPARKIQKSIAVLPFSNMSSDHENEYFSDGISEEILNALVKTNTLPVIARTSSFQFKGQNLDVQKIGKQLKVSHLLEGSVRRSGSNVRITAQLVETVTGIHLWSDTYDRNLRDIFEVQEEISLKIVEQIGIALPMQNASNANSENQQRGRSQRGTDNLDAYQSYLKGTQHVSKRSKKSMAIALADFQRAVEADPTYAKAWAGLAHTQMTLALWGVTPRAAGMLSARTSANTAIGYDSTLPSPYRTLAEVQSRYEWNFGSASASMATAYNLAPGDADVIAAYGSMLSKNGKTDEAVRQTEKAWAMDPLNISIAASLCSRYINANRFDDADRALNCILELNPDHADRHWLRARIHLGRQDFLAAIESIAEEELDHLRLSISAIAFHHLGKVHESDELLEELIEKDAVGAAFQIAEVYAQRRDVDQTFVWLERAYNTRDPGIAELFSCASFRRLYDVPRFIEFAERVKLTVPLDEM